MSENDQAVSSGLCAMVRRELISKLKSSRLAPTTRKEKSGQGIPDMKVVTGFEDLEFVHRFGLSLEKVEDADIAALTLCLPLAESLEKALAELRKHIADAPEGKTGLPYFDEWQPADDAPAEERPLVWSHDSQDEARSLLAQGWRISKSYPSSGEAAGVFFTIFISR